MFCSRCGNEMDENSRFCSKCGIPVGKTPFEGNSPSSEEKIVENKIAAGSNITNAVSEEVPTSLDDDRMPNLVSLKPKRAFNKKFAITLSLVFLLVLAGLGIGIFIVKAKTDDFRTYMTETEKKAKTYSSLGKYDDEYSSLIQEANKLADTYNIFKFDEEKEKFTGLFKNVDDLKNKIATYDKRYKDIVNETEVENKFVFGDYTEKYENTKDKITKAFASLDEEQSKEGVEELERMLADIRAYNDQKAKEYQSKLKEMSASGDYLDAEKVFIKTAKKELESALKKVDYVKAEEVFNDFNEQKKRYDNVIQTDYFKNFVQMDVSEDNTIKLYYEDDGTIWNKDKFTLLEKGKSGKTWTAAEIISMNQVEGKLSIDLVADVSSSMEDIFYDMKESVKSFANSTDDDTELGLSIISDVYRRESEFTDDKESITDLVDELYCDGLTSLYQSLYSSVIYTASQPGSKCVVAFTDGVNVPYGTGYDFSEDDVIEVARRYKIPVYMIAIGTDVDSSVLRNIAYSTGGKYYENTSVYDLYNVYDEIYNSQKTRYELAYKSNLSNNKTREVYINYYDDERASGFRSEFAMKPDIILNGYSGSGVVDSDKLLSYYTNKKYISIEEISRLRTIGDLQTVINIYYAKSGFKFDPDGDVLVQLKNMGIINHNGTKTMAKVTSILKKDDIVWSNLCNLFNYRYEWLYRVASRLYNDGYRDIDELSEAVHNELGERRDRFINVLKKIYESLE